ncbi:MAG: LacI family DNA-binding transcriptional regulator [Clostridiales bacterium]|nr:LacI family DNA-binding transcriptional regulator [Clostridiales bacterium]
MNIYDISEKAGVSIATVSRVLNNSARVSQKTREKVLSVMAQYDYVPNPFARGLGLKTMRTIGLLCPNASDYYLAMALSYLERMLRKQGYDSMLLCTGKALSDREKGVEWLISKHVDGIILMGSTFVEDNENGNKYLRNAATHLPLVLLNASYANENIYSVLCDDFHATMNATQFLLEKGRRNILYLYHNRNYSGLKKLDGYKAALKNMGVPVQEKLIQYFTEDKMSIPDIRDYILGLDRKGIKFDAVVTSEDVMGVGVFKYARIIGRNVPEDLPIIGYNNSSYCLCCEPELSSVDNKLEMLCEQSVITLLKVLSGESVPQKMVFMGELVLRGST